MDIPLTVDINFNIEDSVFTRIWLCILRVGCGSECFQGFVIESLLKMLLIIPIISNTPTNCNYKYKISYNLNPCTSLKLPEIKLCTHYETIMAQYFCVCTCSHFLVPEPQPSLSDSKEIDFGFWEKASSLPSDKIYTTSQPTKELDLNLL